MLKLTVPLATLAACSMIASPSSPTTPEQAVSGNKEQSWRQLQDAAANESDHAKQAHADIVQYCGHDVHVVFDWPSFDMQRWLDAEKTMHMPDGMAGSYCAYQLTELAYACRAEEYKPYQKDAVKKLKTLTCHYKPCAQLPDPPNSHPGANLVATEAQYALGADGTNLDETYCENEMNQEAVLRAWLQKL